MSKNFGCVSIRQWCQNRCAILNLSCTIPHTGQSAAFIAAKQQRYFMNMCVNIEYRRPMRSQGREKYQEIDDTHWICTRFIAAWLVGRWDVSIVNNPKNQIWCHWIPWRSLKWSKILHIPQQVHRLVQCMFDNGCSPIFAIPHHYKASLWRRKAFLTDHLCISTRRLLTYIVRWGQVHHRSSSVEITVRR